MEDGESVRQVVVALHEQILPQRVGVMSLPLVEVAALVVTRGEHLPRLAAAMFLRLAVVKQMVLLLVMESGNLLRHQRKGRATESTGRVLSDVLK